MTTARPSCRLTTRAARCHTPARTRASLAFEQPARSDARSATTTPPLIAVRGRSARGPHPPAPTWITRTAADLREQRRGIDPLAGSPSVQREEAARYSAPAMGNRSQQVIEVARRAIRVLARGTNELDVRRLRCPDCGSALENSDGLYRTAGMFGAIAPDDAQRRMHCRVHGRPPFNEPARSDRLL